MVERTAQKHPEHPGAAPDAAATAGATGQLALPFVHHSRFDRADFVAARSNEAARALLLGGADWPEYRLALWGAAGAGKTHLLHVWARESGAVMLDGRDVTTATVTTATLGRLFAESPARLAGVAVDDADRAAEPRALLHLLNMAREHRLKVAMAARLPPARWPSPLPDLASRLRATMAAELRQPEDSLLRILLLRHLAARQIVVSQPVTEWLLRRLPRTASAIRDAAARLDQAGLMAGRRVTRALAVGALHDMLAPEDVMPEDLIPEGPVPDGPIPESLVQDDPVREGGMPGDGAG